MKWKFTGAKGSNITKKKNIQKNKSPSCSCTFVSMESSGSVLNYLVALVRVDMNAAEGQTHSGAV